jgi:hypothetical protein
MATLVVLLALVALAAGRAAPAFPGYILSAQYRCDDVLCPDWELDLSRVDPSFRLKNLTETLDTLVPKSPISVMNFPVFTAYHEPERLVTVLASQVSRDRASISVGWFVLCCSPHSSNISSKPSP